MDRHNALARTGQSIHIAGWLALALVIIHTGRTVVAALAAAPRAASGLDLFNAGLRGLIEELPYLALLAGLHAMTRLGARYHAGECFTRANALSIREFGTSLLGAAAAFFVFRPSLLAWTGGQPGGFEFHIDEAGIAMAVTGVFVTAMAQVMAMAAALQEDHDGIV